MIYNVVAHNLVALVEAPTPEAAEAAFEEALIKAEFWVDHLSSFGETLECEDQGVDPMIVAAPECAAEVLAT